jgi:hypothetical protein
METRMTHLETVEYRVALVNSSSLMLMSATSLGGYRLPRVRIPKYSRAAEKINEAICKEWRLRTLILTFLNTINTRPTCVVAELIAPQEAHAPQGLAFEKIDRLDESELDAEERTSLHSLIVGDVSASGPFARLGWIPEAQEWIRETIHDHRVEFTDDIRQLNASATFALVRFPARDGTAYWLKATGAPNRHELGITSLLSKVCPEYLPPLLATRNDWNAWATREAGETIDLPGSFIVFEEAVRSLADLQKRTIGYAHMLFNAGAADQRTFMLSSHVDEVMDYLAAAMDRQISTKVPRLTRRRLTELGSILLDALAKIEMLGIPDTLIHNDINAGNILLDGTRCVFIDWAETYVGNPFLALQLFSVMAADYAPQSERTSWQQQFREVYRQRWLGDLSAAAIDEVYALVPLLSIYSHLYGRGDWLDSDRGYEPHFEGYARSLARYMDRAAREPEFLEALC